MTISWCQPMSHSHGGYARAGVCQVSKGSQRLLALLKGFLAAACDADNSSLALSTLLALRDVAALATAIPPVLHRRDFQVGPPHLAPVSLRTMQGAV